MSELEQALARKQAVRERVWRRLEEEGAARFPGAWGRIPNFAGAAAAAKRLAASPAWREASVIKANPDAPQLPVRALALADGKLLYMAVPRLASSRPFLALDPGQVGPPRQAASIRGAAHRGVFVGLEEMRKVDLVVCGSVAVTRAGARLGKGGGYSDLEFALLVEAGRIDARTSLATTVHQLQVLDEELPETDHDFRVDLVVTPVETIVGGSGRRPAGILWEHLDPDKVDEVPVLRELARARGWR
ncbi:5-formyltetrahydrofolate cyclo-ligase [Candidatus Nephthysia bennettiae]|uniref:5-formyltetrahydrofolate cyclo-ligase n=1 Tax=Candidatus Nephthysia bennettiae TaxID=3127016 RepID=A0A934K6A8_9BACT|nr:5-formyltetrahydrofolate cyclo-ligase [Candidatus Dormibacteraeota bacterium]MBJ7612635.1 5-formyltetrahydrofolate cyclo-ligase [Candidatus Dormibacteraeota bacterium]